MSKSFEVQGVVHSIGETTDTMTEKSVGTIQSEIASIRSLH